jgi:uroporphyrinogen decarboxylase
MDRVPLTEIAVWPETEERWRQEGLPTGVSVEDYFGLDKIELFSYEPSLLLPYVVEEDGEREQVILDADGCRYRRWKEIQRPPQFLGSTVNSAPIWRELRGRLTPELSRFETYRHDFIFDRPTDVEQTSRYRRAREEGQFTVIAPTEPCWYFLRLLGLEDALVAMALEPDFVEEVISDYTEFVLGMLEALVSSGFAFDALWVFSDLAYKNGMLFSPNFYRERVAPYQRRIFAFAHDHAMNVIYHCDGYVGELIPLLRDVGVDCIQPLEARAGNDVRRYLQEYGDRLSFMGNINADALAGGKERVRQEICDKLPEAKSSGRYIFHSDHSVPVTVSFEDYSYAIELAKEIAPY